MRRLAMKAMQGPPGDLQPIARPCMYLYWSDTLSMHVHNQCALEALQPFEPDTSCLHLGCQLSLPKFC